MAGMILMSGLSLLQLLFRKGRVMASDAAAYLSLDPWRSAIAAWASNLQLVPDEGNVRMRAGLYLEAGLCEWAKDDLGRESYERPQESTPYLDWAGATPDMMFPEGDGVQIKVHALHMAADYDGMPYEYGEWSNAQVPERYLIQCQHEMLVTGAEQWWLGPYFGGGDFRLYPIKRDNDLLDLMQTQLYAFWKRHLDPNGPQEQPPIDGSDSASSYLQFKHRRVAGNLLPATDEARLLAQRYAELRSRGKEIEVAQREAQNLLCDLVGEAEGIEGVVTWRSDNPKPKTNWELVAKTFKTWPRKAKAHTTRRDPQRRFYLKYQSEENSRE